MGTRIFVGNLAYASSEATVRAHFEQAGFAVRSARVIVDRETGGSRGFGFVELADDAELARAIEVLDGSVLEGRRLSIREAHDRREGGGGRPRDFGHPPRPGERALAPARLVVERVGAGEARSPAPSRGARSGPVDGRGFARPFEPPPEPGWAKGEGRRSRKFDGKKGRRREDDDDADW